MAFVRTVFVLFAVISEVTPAREVLLPHLEFNNASVLRAIHPSVFWHWHDHIVNNSAAAFFGSQSVFYRGRYPNPSVNIQSAIGRLLRRSPSTGPSATTASQTLNRFLRPPTASYVLRLENGFIADAGYTFDERGQYLLGWPRNIFPAPSISTGTNSVEYAHVHLQGAVAPLFHVWSHSFQHFVFDQLPRLQILLDAMPRLALEQSQGARLLPQPKLRLLVHNGAAFELLPRLLPHIELIRAEPGTIYSADIVLDARFYPFSWFGNVPFGLFSGVIETQSLLALMQQANTAGRVGGTAVTTYDPDLGKVKGASIDMGRHVNISSTEPRLVLYVTRAGAAKRMVANEGEVLAALQRVCAEHHSPLELRVFTPSSNLTDNILRYGAMFHRARVFIGPHGGGLANAIFAGLSSSVHAGCSGCTSKCALDSGTGAAAHSPNDRIALIEFSPLVAAAARDTNPRACYYGLAGALGFDYFAVEPDLKPQQGLGLDFGFDARFMRVAPERAKEALQLALS